MKGDALVWSSIIYIPTNPRNCPLSKLISLEERNLDEILECNDVNMAAELLVSKISVILDEMDPIKTVQVRSNFVPGLEDETK